MCFLVTIWLKENRGVLFRRPTLRAAEERDPVLRQAQAASHRSAHQPCTWGQASAATSTNHLSQHRLPKSPTSSTAPNAALRVHRVVTPYPIRGFINITVIRSQRTEPRFWCAVHKRSHHLTQHYTCWSEYAPRFTLITIINIAEGKSQMPRALITSGL